MQHDAQDEDQVAELPHLDAYAGAQATGRWTRDAYRIRRWLEQADETPKGGEECAAPEVSWKVLSRLRRDG